MKGGRASRPRRFEARDGPAAGFVLANTALEAPPLVPEVRLHLAADSLAIWEKVEARSAHGSVPPPYWAFAWAGGQALSRILLDEPQLVAGKNVLDLGAGSGLVAIAARKAHAARALACDTDDLAQVAIALNADANDVEVATTAEDLLSASPQPYDVVLVGDLFYERALASRVLSFIEAEARRGALILIGDPGRNYFPHGRFAKLVEYDVPVICDLENLPVKRTAVWRL